VLHGITRSVMAARRRLSERISGQSDEVVELMVDAGALVAAADGVYGASITGEEANAVLRAARQIANLQGLGLRRVVHRFDDTRRLLQRSPAVHDHILDRCARLRHKPRAAGLVLQVAEAVAAIDGEVSDAERHELTLLAEALGLKLAGEPSRNHAKPNGPTPNG
jgi:tellurite resistance protein